LIFNLARKEKGEDMKRIIDGKVYNTETAKRIADNQFRDGSNRMNCGTCTTLYKTIKGNFFAYHETCWQGERDSIEPLAKEEARKLFEQLDGDADYYVEHFGAVEEA
jgi:hypothetical protein